LLWLFLVWSIRKAIWVKYFPICSIGYPYKINKFEVKGFFEFFTFFLIRKSIQGTFIFIQCLSVFKNILLLCHWKCLCHFFYVQRVSLIVIWFVIDGYFLFFFLSLLLQKLQLDPPSCLLVFSCWYFNFNSYFFDLWFLVLVFL
jgi:hypothetical protein